MASTGVGKPEFKIIGPDLSGTEHEERDAWSFAKHSSSSEQLKKNSDARKENYKGKTQAGRDKDDADAVFGNTIDQYRDQAHNWQKGDDGALSDIFGKPANVEQAMTQQIVKDILVSEKPVGTWLDFWEAIDKNVPSIMDGIDKGKTALLMCIDVMESIMTNVKTLVEILLGLVGKALEIASLAILLAKAVLQAIKAAIKQLIPMFQIPLLKSEMKVAWFNLWDKLTPEPVQKKNGPKLKLSKNINRMAPFVSSTLKDMCNNWFNRPTAEDELCMAMLIPGSFPGETAEFLESSLNFIELLCQKPKFDWPKAKNTYTQYNAGQLLSHLNYMADSNAAFRADTALLRTACATASDLTASTVRDIFGKQSAGSTYWGVPDVYKAVRTAELDTVTKHSKAYKSSVSGVLSAAAAKLEGDGVTVEFNFVNGQSCYISSIYKVKPDGTTEEVFNDPSFSFAQALVADRTKDFIDDMVALFNAAVEWWYASTRSDRETKLRDELESKLFGPVFGKGLYTRCAKAYPIEVQTDSDLFFAAVQQCLSKKEFKDEITKYDSNYSEDFSDLKYAVRYTIMPSIPRISPSVKLKIKDVEANDRLVFVLISDKAKYFGHDFLKDGDTAKPPSYYNLWTPGDFSANLRPMYASVQVQDEKNAVMLEPRWYGAGTPAWASDITAGWIFSKIPWAKDMFGVPLRFLDTLDAYLDKLGENINSAKELVRQALALFERYHNLIMNMLEALKKFLLAFGLPSWPSVYVVTWKGGIRDLPNILMSALQEERLANSTYAGFILFGAWSGPTEFTEMYKAHNRTIAEWEAIKARSKAIAAQIEAEADAMAKMEDSLEALFDKNWLGLDEYNAKMDAEDAAKDAERQRRMDEFYSRVQVKPNVLIDADGVKVLSFDKQLPDGNDPRVTETVSKADLPANVRLETVKAAERAGSTLHDRM